MKYLDSSQVRAERQVCVVSSCSFTVFAEAVIGGNAEGRKGWTVVAGRPS